MGHTSRVILWSLLFMNQNIATEHLLIEAKRRMKDQERDETEYFDGQLLEAIERLQSGE